MKEVIETNGNNTGTIPLRKEILFDGYFYDVTDFVKRHPGTFLNFINRKIDCFGYIYECMTGGSIIEFYTKSGEDATHAIQQFHQRSTKRVSAIMRTLKKRPASDSESMKSII